MSTATVKRGGVCTVRTMMILVLMLTKISALTVPTSVVHDYSAAAATWMNGMRTPAALVAGSALSSLSDTTVDYDFDKRSVRYLKHAMRFALLTSFMLELVVIFIATVTATKLLGNADLPSPTDCVAASAVGLMHREFEFEYVALRFCFLQGLLNWLAGVAVKFSLPAMDEKKPEPERALAKLYSRAVVTMVLFMLAFYQRHLAFYGNYLSMMHRLLILGASKMLLPIRPTSSLMLLALAGTFQTLVTAVRADLRYKVPKKK